MNDHETTILRHWAEASPEARAAAGWYGARLRESHALAKRYGVTYGTAAGVIAALSPRQQWAVNLRSAEAVLKAARQRKRCPAVGFGDARRKAWRIAKGERPLDVLGGPKVRAFYRNLIGDLDYVTVDIWAMRGAGLEGHPSERTYPIVAAAYATIAEAVGLRPAELQAVVWTHVRGRAE